MTLKAKLGFKHYLGLFPVVALLILISHPRILGQVNTPSALKPGSASGSAALSGFESITPHSGNLNFSLPLYEVGGRGSVSLPIKLNINQKWYAREWADPEDSGRPYSYAIPEEDDPDWEPKRYLQVKIKGRYLVNGYKASCPPGSGQIPPTDTLTLLFFTAPDGTQVELRDRATKGQPKQNTWCGAGWPAAYSRGNIFDAVDGSGITFISDTSISDDPYASQPRDFGVTGKLIMRDGTTYKITNGSAGWSIADRNGNKHLVTYGPGLNTQVKDPLNRETTIEYAVQDTSPYGLSDRITYKGFEGTERIVRVSYKYLHDVLRPGYSIQTHKQLFPNNFIEDYPGTFPESRGTQIYDPLRPSAVWLPDGRKYEFQYNSYGEISKVILPTGGAITYEWGENTGSGYLDLYGFPAGIIFRRVIERKVYSDGFNLDSKLVVSGLESLGNKTGYVNEDLYDGQGTLINRTKHFYFGVLGSTEFSTNGNPFYENWRNGREFQTEIYTYPGNVHLRTTTSTWQQASPSWYTGTSASAPVNHPKIMASGTVLVDSNQVSARTFAYDNLHNLTDTFEYDYGIGAPGNFLRRSHTDYLTTNPVNSSNYTSDNIHILGLQSQTWVSSDINGNNKVSLTKFEYDNYVSDSTHAPLVDRFNISGHDSNFGTSFVTRGNLTKITSYADAQVETGAVSTYRQCDIAGNVIKTIDAKGTAVTINYSDRFGSPDGEAKSNLAPSLLGGQETFAFATSSINTIGYTTYAQFDYSTGAGVDTEDIVGNVSSVFYNDPLDRPTKGISAANSTNFKKQTAIIYDDLNRKVTVTSDSKNYNDNLIKAESFYDKMGRTVETRQYETGPKYIVGLTEYDSLGRAYKSSTPHRPHLSEQPEWTITSFDSLGRVIQVKTPDNTTIGRAYSGTTVTVTDQWNRKRTGVSDAIGRLLNVIEDPNGLNQETTYTYDVLGRLRKTTQTEGQTTQNRYFMYNDLGRLIRAKQPEQAANASLNITDPISGNTGWSVSYSHDANGNTVLTTDANSRTITGTYDNLNRLTYRDYSGTTPDVSFTYDDINIPNSKGQLTAIASGLSSTYFTAFDQLGRVKSSRQSTNGTNYDFPDYTYDLSGSLVSQTYPSGRVVETELDDIGRLSKITSLVPNQVERTYLSNIAFTSFGAVQHAKLGNGRWESAQFDPKRQQTEEFHLGGSVNDSSLLKIEYDFGATDNNGSLRQQKITVPDAVNPIIQNYTYDMLNRLQSATETAGSQVTWKQTFQYDRFGNKRFDATNTTTLPADNNIYNPQIDPATNRFTTPEGYSYDSDGNLTSNPEGQLFTYDAENRQTQVDNTASQQTANYFYDGNSKRVRKLIGDEETVFVYDAFGKLAAEYSTVVENRPKTISYLTTDDLGSPRVVTDQLGQVVSRHDYLPFGEEAMAGVGGRTTTQGYGGVDGVRKQFTGYERDDESGLDFAQARYFKGGHGRFTSVDPLASSANIKNPQSLNRYSYALNSPYRFVDPLGLKPCLVPGGGNTGCIEEGTEPQSAITQDPQTDPSKIVVPKEIKEYAGRTGIDTTTVGGTQVRVVYDQDYIDLRKSLADVAYRENGAISNDNYANDRTNGEQTPKSVTESEGRKDVEGNRRTDSGGGEINVSPGGGAKIASGGSTEREARNERDSGRSVESASNNTVDASRKMEAKLNGMIVNYLNRKADAQGNLSFRVEGSTSRYTASRNIVQRQLSAFVQTVQNVASCNFNKTIGCN